MLCDGKTNDSDLPYILSLDFLFATLNFNKVRIINSIIFPVIILYLDTEKYDVILCNMCTLVRSDLEFILLSG